MTDIKRAAIDAIKAERERIFRLPKRVLDRRHKRNRIDDTRLIERLRARGNV